MHRPSRLSDRVSGTVEQFDVEAGLGVIALDGDESVGFHCTAIADGTRTIDVGVRVGCSRRLGHLGGVEAVDIERVG